MQKTFYDRLKASEAYKDLIGESKLTNRESALLSLACARAENEIGKLQRTLATQKGQIEAWTLRTKAAVLLGQSGEIMRSSLLFLVTPYASLKPTLQLPQEGVHEAAARKQTKDESVLLTMLPEWARGPVHWVGERIGSLSPLTTVILFAAVVAGSATYAKHQYGSIERSYKLVVEENERLKGNLESTKQTEAQLQTVRNEKDELSRRVAVAEDRSNTQSRTIEALQTQLSELATSHKQELEIARGKLDDATKDALRRQDVRIADLQRELTEKSDALTLANEQLNSIRFSRDASDQQQRQIQALNEAAQVKDKRIRELQGLERDVISLQTFVTDLLSSIRKNLLENNPQYTTISRETFRNDYRLIYARDKAYFDRMGLQQF